MKKILFDSDVIIEYLRENPTIVKELGELAASDAVLAVTPVTEAEILRGLRSHERERTEGILNSFECLDLNRIIGRKAGDYMRRYAKTHALEVPDALIASTAVFYRFSLCTLNWKHYPMTEINRYRVGI